ncbi:MAG: hypothetical protein KA132_08295, partial [Thauera sp.]|nr:hypothetical protein [Thauera sp.]
MSRLEDDSTRFNSVARGGADSYGATAAAAIAGQIQQAYVKNNIATAAATAADLIRQNAVPNAIN